MRWTSSVTFWIPFAFAALLSAFMLSNRETGWPALYSLLPMAFFFTGGAFMEVVRRIRKPEERIKVLEGKA